MAVHSMNQPRPYDTPDSWPDAYVYFFGIATDQVIPLLKMIREDRPGLPITGPASDHDAQADDLESFVRPLLMVGQWLPVADQCSDARIQAMVSQAKEWIQRSVRIGSDSASPCYWGGSRNFHQNQVEMGLFALILCLNDGYVYHLLDAESKQQLSTWMATGRGCSMHRNNHMFFGIFILEFLNWSGAGQAGDRALIDAYFLRLESMYYARGWFMDGMNETFDYYNAFAFHYYGLWWAILFGRQDETRAERWKGWSADFLKSYAHLFSSEGDFPMFGRSMTYRFGVIAPFALAEYLEISPLTPGTSRRLCRLNLEFFLKHSIAQAEGCWSVGFVDENPTMAESYTCGASPYWGAKGFSYLTLPAEHVFWTEEETGIPSETGDGVIALPEIGLLFRRFAGATELFNAGVAISECNTRFGPFKWGKQSYRSGVGTLLPKTDQVPLDSALVAHVQGTSKCYGRYVTVPIEVSERCIVSTYSLGEKTSPFHVKVKMLIFWNKHWLLQVHLGHARQACRLTQGTYALGGICSNQSSLITDDFAVIHVGGSRVSFQNLAGYESISVETREQAQRSHSHQLEHALLVGTHSLSHPGAVKLVSITGVGDEAELNSAWSVVNADGGGWMLEHPYAGKWTLSHPDLPAL